MRKASILDPWSYSRTQFFFSTLGKFSCILWPWPWKRKNNTVDFFTLPREEETQQAAQWSWTRLAFQSGSISSFSFAQMLSRVGQTWTANSNNYSKIKQLHSWRYLQIETQTESRFQDKDFLPWIHSPSRLKKHWLNLWWVLKIAPIPVAH